MFIIGGVQKCSMIDFPQKVAAVVFTQGCNFRCGYCHNPSLINFPSHSVDFGTKLCRSFANAQDDKLKYTCKNFLSFLQTRKGKLDGVVISGGEPTLQLGLYNFIKEIKQMEFAVKLDTNGTNLQMLEELINDNLLDYVAMDIKAPIEKYDSITGVKTAKDNVLKSIDLIKNCGVEYEFRTTVVKSLLSMEDIEKIGRLICGSKRYYLQKFVASKIYDESLHNAQTYTDCEFEALCESLKKYIDIVEYR